MTGADSAGGEARRLRDAGGWRAGAARVAIWLNRDGGDEAVVREEKRKIGRAHV